MNFFTFNIFIILFNFNQNNYLDSKLLESEYEFQFKLMNNFGVTFN